MVAYCPIGRDNASMYPKRIQVGCMLQGSGVGTRGAGGGLEPSPKFFKEGLSPPKKSVWRDFNHVNVVLDSVLEWLEC